MSWSDEDQDKALEWVRFQAQFCSNCGTAPDAWLDDEGMQLEIPPFQVETMRCYGCVALEMERESVPRGKAGIHLYLAPFKEKRGEDE